MSPAIKLHFYGDSHLTDVHFFKESLEDVVQGMKSWRFSQIEASSIHAKGGAIIDMNFVNIFSEYMLKEEPFPQLHVFQIGGNNLRNALHQGNSKAILSHVQGLFNELILKAGSRKNVHLVFCSIIPSPKHEPHSNDLFWEMNHILQKLASYQPEMVSYLDLKLVAGVSHRAKPDLFNGGKIHLNKTGAMFMANKIAQFLQHLPASHFGILSRKEAFDIVNS